MRISDWSSDVCSSDLKGRILLKAAEQLLREAAVADVTTLHRHGGVVETILEREDHARVVVMGKRGVGHEYAADHIGSMIERVVRASEKPVLVASREYSEPQHIVFAYEDRKSTRLNSSH